MKLLKKYRDILKSEGWKGLIREAGWPAAILVFSFFLGKGIIWLIIFYFGAKQVAG